MLCSILLPTRSRPDRLLKTIHSIRDSASRTDWEILLRIDDDDALTKEFVFGPDFSRATRTIAIKTKVGPRYNGYSSVSTFYKELEELAQGTWCWMANDDLIVLGENWDGKLEQVVTSGHIVQPEMSRIGESSYPRVEGQSFPIVPRNFWQSVEPKMDYLDTPIHQLCMKLGWTTYFLPGITMWHQRDGDEKINEHRKMPCSTSASPS